MLSPPLGKHLGVDGGLCGRCVFHSLRNCQVVFRVTEPFCIPPGSREEPPAVGSWHSDSLLLWMCFSEGGFKDPAGQVLTDTE